MNLSKIIIIFLKSKTSRHKNLSKTILVILSLHNIRKSIGQISDSIKITIATIALIIH